MKSVKKQILLSLFPCVLFLLSGHSHADKEMQSLDVLTKIADVFIQGYLSDNNRSDNFDIEIAPLDSRLRLRHCDGEIIPFWPYSTGNLGRLSVGLRCNGTTRWKVFLQSTIRQYRSVAALNTPVNRGQTLTSAMLSVREIDVLSHRQAVVEDATPLLGHVFKQNVKANTPLSERLLKLPLLIKRGDLVRMVSSGTVVSVDAEVEVLSDGYANQRVKVKNTRTGKMIYATVMESSLVIAQ